MGAEGPHGRRKGVSIMSVHGSSCLIQNARLITNAQTIDNGWIHVENGKVAALGANQPPRDLAQAHAMNTVDVKGQWVVPGFIDIHVHGADGVEVMDGTPEAIRKIGRFHAMHGTTGWLPTTLTASIPALEQSLRASKVVQEDSSAPAGAAVLGVHLEGPFISPDKIGAQNPDFVAPPTIETMERLANVAPGLVKKITIAPERRGAIEVIAWLAEHGIIPSIGHTDATFTETMLGIQAGARHATHLFNAMRGLHHRDGGVVGASLLSDEVLCELIVDGHHVDLEVVKLVLRLKGAEKIALITDAISATGKPDGCYQLGGLDITVKDGKSVLSDGHTLAGSTLTMDGAVRNMVNRVGVSLQDAVQMASTTPARELGFSAHKGDIGVGYDADFVVLDESLQVSRTFVGGTEVFCRI